MLIWETALLLGFYYVVPALVIIGSIIALIVIIKKKGKQVFLPYAVFPVISLLCMFVLGLHIKEGAPYSREPNAENVELVAEERNRAEYPISDDDLNAVFETCIDYFKNSGEYDFCELTGLRYLYMYSPGGNDVAMIEASYKSGFFSNVTHYGKFYALKREQNSNKWVFESVNTGP